MQSIPKPLEPVRRMVRRRNIRVFYPTEEGVAFLVWEDGRYGAHVFWAHQPDMLGVTLAAPQLSAPPSKKEGDALSFINTINNTLRRRQGIHWSAEGNFFIGNNRAPSYQAILPNASRRSAEEVERFFCGLVKQFDEVLPAFYVTHQSGVFLAPPTIELLLVECATKH